MNIISRFAILGILLLLFANKAMSAGTQTFLKELTSTNTPEIGSLLLYRLSAACNSLTSDCGNLTITDTLPAGLSAQSCNAPSGFTVVTCSGSDIEITKNTVYNGGDSFVIDITARVELNTVAGTDLINTATGEITDPEDPANGTVTSTANTATVADPSMQWVLKKNRTSPATNLQPTWDTDVSYTVEMCSSTAIGNVDLVNAQMIDVFPAGAVVVNNGGGTVAGNQITWNLGNLDLPTLYATASYSSEVCISRNYTLRYPQANFPDGTQIVNTLSGNSDGPNVCDGSSGAGSCEPVNIDENIGIPTPGAGLSKSADDVLPGAAGGTMSWSIAANVNNSNAPVPDLIIYEDIPVTPAGLQAVSITSGRWNSPATTNAPGGSDVQADIAYSTDATACDDGATTYTDLATNLASPASSTTYALPANTTCVRWIFRDQGADGPAVPRGWSFTTNPVYVVNTENVVGPYPVAVQNCVFATYTEFDGSTGRSGPSCTDALIEEATPDINFDKSRTGGGNNTPPGAEIQFRLRIRHDQSSSTGPIVDPVMTDLLPDVFEFVSWDSTSMPGGKPEPNLEVIDDFNGTGRTMLRFSWAATPPAGSIQSDGSPGVANSTSIEETETVNVRFTIRIKDGTPPNTYTNIAELFDNSPRHNCSPNAVDTGDHDSDGDSTESVCTGEQQQVVVSAAVLGGAKWVKGDPALPHIDDPVTNPVTPDALCPDDGNGYTRFPCVAQTQHGGNFTYQLKLSNTGNETLTNYIMYDVLPAINDTGVGEPLSGAQRGTTWEGTLQGPITPANAFATSVMGQAGSTIEYSTAADPCRPEVSSNNDETGWQTGCDNTWVTTVADYSQVTAFRIIAPFTDAPYWQPGELMLFDVNMQAPASGLPSIPGDSSVFNPAWNSIAHRATQQSNSSRLPTAEPRQVGIVLPSGYRLGNLVWFDANSNGIAESGENGIGNVQVVLFNDDDGTAGPSAGDTQLSTTTTDADGKYAFGGLADGDYFVMIPDPTSQAALASLASSSQGEESDPNSNGDNNDNGVQISTVGALTGVTSNVVTLGPGSSEPNDEDLRSDDTADDDNDAYPDQLSNYSVDFGFRQLYDLGDSIDPTFATLDASNGARHQLGSNVYLGTCVDGEPDGQPTTIDEAVGDDNNRGDYVVGTCTSNDDEDGVTFPFEMIQGEDADLTIVANEACLLNAWIDWNDDGSWTEANDQIATDVALTAGSNTLTISIPENLPESPTHARFRCSTAGGDSFTGLATDGEVEDYTIQTKQKLIDLEVVKLASVENVLAGDTFTYTITVFNRGEGDARDITITDQLPTTQVAYVSDTPSTGSYNDGTGLWTIPLILAGQSATLEIVVTVLP